MANNKIVVKRTSTAGRTPNTTNIANLQYIAAGELALNMTDKTFFTSDGTNLIYVGSNVVNQAVSGNLSLTTNDKRLTFTPLAGGSNAYFALQNDDNFVFYTTNTTNQPRDVWSIFANNNTANLKIAAQTTFNGNVDLNIVAVYANGSPGTTGQILTSNGTSTYWVSPAAASVNVAAQYAWTNTHSFAANVSFSNNIGLASAGGIYFNLVADANWRMGRNTGGVGTKFFYTGNTLDIVAANSSLEGIAFGYTGNTYLETGYNGTYTRNPIYVGNSTQNIVTTNTTLLIQANSTVNSTHTASLVQISNSTSTANLTAIDLKIGATTVVNSTQVTATLHVGNVSGSYANITGQVNTATLYAATSANIASAVQANATGLYTTGIVNAASHTVGTAFTANSTVVNAVAYYSGTLLVANSTVSNATHLGGTIASGYQTTAGLSANVATLTSNNATFMNGNNVLSVMQSLRANRSLHGGGTITVDGSGNVLWSARYIVISNGRGAHFSTNGYFDIDCPSTGTITGVGGAANKTATAAGIPLAAWEALYYILPIGSGNGSVAANFRVVSYTSDVEIPSNWLLICAQNGDNSNYYFNNGIILKASQSFAGATFTSANMPQANNANNLGGTAAASYVQNTDSRTLSGNLVISGTSFTPSSNTILLGNSTQRWVLSANTGSFSGAVSGITTLAAGNTTITGFANVTTSVNSALFSVGTSFIANTTGAYHTGTVNAASYTVGTAFTANSLGVHVGANVVANVTTLKVSNTTFTTTNAIFGGTITTNGSIGTAGQVLTSGAGTNAYWAAAAGGGYYIGGTAAVGTLAAGGQNIFRVNANTINYNTTFVAGENGQATGPIAVASGITLTVQTGARISIV